MTIPKNILGIVECVKSGTATESQLTTLKSFIESQGKTDFLVADGAEKLLRCARRKSTNDMKWLDRWALHVVEEVIIRGHTAEFEATAQQLH